MQSLGEKGDVWIFWVEMLGKKTWEHVSPFCPTFTEHIWKK
jgi:hypothetical protein